MLQESFLKKWEKIQTSAYRARCWRGSNPLYICNNFCSFQVLMLLLTFSWTNLFVLFNVKKESSKKEIRSFLPCCTLFISWRFWLLSITIYIPPKTIEWLGMVLWLFKLYLVYSFVYAAFNFFLCFPSARN